MSPVVELNERLWSAVLGAQAIHVAAVLGLADLVASGPKTVCEIARATGTEATSLARVLRALTCVGVFIEAGHDRFGQNDLSDVLRTDHPHSLRARATLLGTPFIWRSIGETAYAVRTGHTAFEQACGTSLFDYLLEHPEEAATYYAGIASAPVSLAACVEAGRFSRFEHVVDVGGGRGALMLAVLAAHPQVRAVVYDVLATLAGASVSTGVADRLVFQAGNFFESVPAGADAYVLSHVIHDWSDERALTILQNCRRAVRDDGRLLIVESLRPPVIQPARALMDLLMTLLNDGRERSEAEFRSLLHDAGFELCGVTPTVGGTLLEGRPI